MRTNLLKLVNESNIPDNYKYYWGYMYNLGVETVVPYLKEKKAFQSGYKVCEIGSAEGGVLHALAEEGAEDCLGTDIAIDRIEIGKKIAELGEIDVKYTDHNIITQEIPEKWKNKFDLVILRDVIEHLDDTTVALKNIKKIIKNGGFLYVTFPPYYSPYGGHQHTVSGKLPSKLPYIHYLPNSLFHSFISSGRNEDIGEVKRLQNIRLTTKKFMNSIEKAGYSIFDVDFYTIRPVFKQKFGLPPVKFPRTNALKFVREFLAMEASYILKK